MARQQPKAHLHGIYQATRGIVFLGTPHRGSGLAKWGQMLAFSIGLLKQTNANIVAVLEQDSEVLERIHNSFQTLVRGRNEESTNRIEVVCFWEELPSPGIGTVSCT